MGVEPVELFIDIGFLRQQYQFGFQSLGVELRLDRFEALQQQGALAFENVGHQAAHFAHLLSDTGQTGMNQFGQLGTFTGSGFDQFIECGVEQGRGRSLYRIQVKALGFEHAGVGKQREGVRHGGLGQGFTNFAQRSSQSGEPVMVDGQGSAGVSGLEA